MSSQNLASLVALSRSFGPGRDLFDAPEDAFHAVLDTMRVELEPTTMLMFLTVESLIRSLKNQRRPAVHSVHDSRWQKDRASGERMMCRMMTQLIKLTQPPKTPRAAKATPKPAKKSTPALFEPTPPEPAPVAVVEPDLPIILPLPELAVEPIEVTANEPEANLEPASPEPIDNPPADAPESSDQIPEEEQEAKVIFANDGTYQIIGKPRTGPSSGELFRRKLKTYNFKRRNPPTDAPHDCNGTPPDAPHDCNGTPPDAPHNRNGTSFS
jgi:hypothetical protein